MSRLISGFIASLFLSSAVHALSPENAKFLSQIDKVQVKISWEFKYHYLQIDGILPAANGGTLQVLQRSSEVDIVGAEGCSGDCKGHLSLDGQNNLFLDVVTMDEGGNPVKLNNEPMKIGLMADNGELLFLNSKFQIDLSLTRATRTPYQFLMGEQGAIVGDRIILFAKLTQYDYTHWKF